ncbi:MAG: MoaD/ThiS family protein [Sedimentibacter sp.]|uniref:MoaD/ThiS family protein n=1 Tax=Sedimentibacter sp. TaxID=1960295 RepID=UPI0031591095
MEIEIRLYTGMFKSMRMILDNEVEIVDVLDKVGVKKEEVEFVTVNGCCKELDERIKDGDILTIFPPLAGG